MQANTVLQRLFWVHEISLYNDFILFHIIHLKCTNIIYHFSLKFYPLVLDISENTSLGITPQDVHSHLYCLSHPYSYLCLWMCSNQSNDFHSPVLILKHVPFPQFQSSFWCSLWIFSPQITSGSLSLCLFKCLSSGIPGWPLSANSLLPPYFWDVYSLLLMEQILSFDISSFCIFYSCSLSLGTQETRSTKHYSSYWCDFNAFLSIFMSMSFRFFVIQNKPSDSTEAFVLL